MPNPTSMLIAVRAPSTFASPSFAKCVTKRHRSRTRMPTSLGAQLLHYSTQTGYEKTMFLPFQQQPRLFHRLLRIFSGRSRGEAHQRFRTFRRHLRREMPRMISRFTSMEDKATTLRHTAQRSSALALSRPHVSLRSERSLAGP